MLAAVPIVLLIVACQPIPPTETPAAPTQGAADEAAVAATLDPEAEQLEMEVTNSELAVGEERITFRIYDEGGNELTGDECDVEVQVYRRDVESGAMSPSARGGALYFGIPVPDGGSWVVYNSFDASGPWAVEANATCQDGWTGRGRVGIEVEGRTDTPRVGDAAPLTDPPTADEADDLSEITSDPNPDPDLYSMTLEEALATDRPAVVILASPSHCETDVCRATLDEVKAVQNSYSDRVNFIHIETHDLMSPAQMSDAAVGWNLPPQSEPWTFVIDERGRVANRVEGPLSRVELELLVKRALGMDVAPPPE